MSTFRRYACDRNRPVADIEVRWLPESMNRRDVRAIEFAQKREWAERFSSDKLKEMLETKKAHGGEASIIREVLRARGEDS
jgi:hypothetical protein